MDKNEDLKEVCAIREKLIKTVKESLGRAGVSTKEMHEVVGMIKDLAECEKDMHEAQYYKEQTDHGGEGKGMMGMIR